MQRYLKVLKSKPSCSPTVLCASICAQSQSQKIIRGPPSFSFSTSPFGKSIREEFGDKFSDDFLPEDEDDLLDKQVADEARIALNRRPLDDMLRHNSDYNGMLYKFDLPVENRPIVFRSQNALIAAEDADAAALTPTETLMEALEADKDTAYQSFIIKLQQNYNNEVDMYGDIKEAGDCSLRVLEFGTPIPFEFIENEEHMKYCRSMFRVNTDIPGALEMVHPNKFLPNLRPVEDFRHTPIIPINEKDLKENQRKIEEKNRKGYYVEIKKDTIYFYSIAALTLGTIFYTFLMANEKQMRMKQELERTKTLKMRAQAGKAGAGMIYERDANSLSKEAQY